MPNPSSNTETDLTANAPDHPDTGNRPDAPTRPEPKRINVAITPDMVKALELVMNSEGVTLTEALRRLVGYGDFVYRAVRKDNSKILVQTNDTIREVVLLS